MNTPAVHTIPDTLWDYFDVLRRRWIYLVTILPLSILGAVYLAYTLPPLYRASGTILLEPSSIPEDMIRTTVTTYASEQLELVWRRIFTNENLTGLVESIDPYPDLDLSPNEKARMISQNTKTERVDPITMEPMLESAAFSVSYLNPDPELAHAVTQRLVQMFLDYTHDVRTEQATETHGFLELRAEDSRERMLELEERLAEFRSRYGNALPDAQTRNLQALDRAERDVDSLGLQILVADERKRSLELQLAQINPNLFDPAGDWRQELALLRAELAEARQKYTENHPDVRRLTRAIEGMSARAGLSPDEAVTPDNPEYIQVASQLDTVTRELAILQSNAARAREEIAGYERNMQLAPEVEQEYSRLMRDYELVRAALQGIEGRVGEAALAQVLESEQRGIRYSLVRAPSVPSSPDSPNRLGIMLLGIVLGGAVAVGLAAVRESADPSVRSARDLAELTDIKPIGTIPVILNDSDRRKRAIAWAAASIATVAALSFVGSVIA
jgi:polysaccharide chain length determinant protein (PEP-CTERM system associated)